MEDAAAIVITCKGRALILLRGSTAPWEPLKWNLPGGTIEPGETPLEAALRECKEETGLVPLEVHPLKWVTDPAGWNLALYQAKHDIRQNVVLNMEHDALFWVPWEDLDRFQFVPQVKEALHELLF